MRTNQRSSTDGSPVEVDLIRRIAAELEQLYTETNGNSPISSASLSLQVRGDGDVDTSVTVSISRAIRSELSAQVLDDPPAQLEFNSEGHHVVALIAAADLAKNAPEVMEAVQAILDAGERTLIEAATFPDDIRSSQPHTRPFHFISLRFEDGGPINPPLPHGPHVLSKIEDFSNEFVATSDPQQKVDALSWLIHLFGDVHQPLHCTERISELHPGGDRGGNSFRLSGRKNNLHSLWDSAVNVSRPFAESELRDQILEQHPRESLEKELTVTEPERWARASHALARKHVYSLEENPERPPRPSGAYIRNMETVGRKQAALAGYRLANHFKMLLSNQGQDSRTNELMTSARP